jgi:hypothetical protein
MVLVAAGWQEDFHVPVWVILSCHAAIAMGTLLGGLFGDGVDLADLSQLSPDALETLKDTEFKEYQKALSTEKKEKAEAKKLNAEYEKMSKQ